MKFFVCHKESFLFEKHFFHINLQLILSTEEKTKRSQLSVALKNGRENDSERRQNHSQQSQVDSLDPSCEKEDFKNCILPLG